jgi:hypothetical protein
MPNQEAAGAHELVLARGGNRPPFELQPLRWGEVRRVALGASSGDPVSAGMLSIGLVEQLLGLFGREDVNLQSKQIRLFCEHPSGHDMNVWPVLSARQGRTAHLQGDHRTPHNRGWTFP